MALIGKDSLEDKVRIKLLRDAVGKHEKDKKKKNAEKNAKIAQNAEWKSIKAKWNAKR